MVPKSRLQEFGFPDEGKFPRHLVNHSVSMTLPSAIERGIDPLEVIVEDGLVVPLQKEGSSGGMIIRSDGMMLYVWHRDPKDPGTPLESRFISEVPYEARVEVNNIMHRAIGADPTLIDIWAKVSAAWVERFPVVERESTLQLAGEFTTVPLAWGIISELIAQLTGKQPRPPGEAILRLVVESEHDFKRGWLGEESVVDEAPLREIFKTGRVKYLLQRLFPRMQKALRSPVFNPRSHFRVYYGAGSVYLIKLIVVPPADLSISSADAVGIEFSLDSLDGFSPSME